MGITNEPPPGRTPNTADIIHPPSSELKNLLGKFKDNDFALRRFAAEIVEQRIKVSELSKKNARQYVHQLQEFDKLIHFDTEFELWNYDFTRHPEGKGMLAEVIFFATLRTLEKKNPSIKISPSNANQDNQGIDFLVTIHEEPFPVDVSGSASEGILWKAGDSTRAFAIIPVQRGHIIKNLPPVTSNLVHKFLNIQNKDQMFPEGIGPKIVMKELIEFHMGYRSLLAYLQEEHDIPNSTLQSTKKFWNTLKDTLTNQSAKNQNNQLKK